MIYYYIFQLISWSDLIELISSSDQLRLLLTAGVTNCKEAAAQGCGINIINFLQCRKFIIFAAVQKIYNFGHRAKIEALLFLMWVLFYAHDWCNFFYKIHWLLFWGIYAWKGTIKWGNSLWICPLNWDSNHLCSKNMFWPRLCRKNMFWQKRGCRINIIPQIGGAENLYDFWLLVTPVTFS